MAARGELAPAAAMLEAVGGHDLYLAGSGSFAVELADWASDAGWEVRGLIELQDSARIGGETDGYPIVGMEPPVGGGCAIVAAGGSRAGHWSRIDALDWEAVTIVHPTAHVSSTATLHPGCIVGPGTVIGALSSVGPHTLVSRGVRVGHHCQIGAFVSLMPGVNIGGHVRIGDETVVGMAGVIVNGTTVGQAATIAAGAVVLGEVGDGARVQGLPAREYQR
jgi:sugar O-acyltransferase (sialic acid O-acetyltransferase NeuD family)